MCFLKRSPSIGVIFDVLRRIGILPGRFLLYQSLTIRNSNENASRGKSCKRDAQGEYGLDIKW